MAAQSAIQGVLKARERLGIESNVKGKDQDTVRILAEAADLSNPRVLLGNREWMEERVVSRDMSDGDISKELGRVGFSCDRSTVRLYRNLLGLSRPSYPSETD